MGSTLLLVAVAVTVAAVLVVPMLRPPARLPRTPGPIASAVLDVLPGGNCGACGNESCFAAAMAVACGAAPASVCVAGGPETARAVSIAVMREQRRGA